jgi:hypothetical protein
MPDPVVLDAPIAGAVPIRLRRAMHNVGGVAVDLYFWFPFLWPAVPNFLAC